MVCDRLSGSGSCSAAPPPMGTSIRSFRSRARSSTTGTRSRSRRPPRSASGWRRPGSSSCRPASIRRAGGAARSRTVPGSSTMPVPDGVRSRSRGGSRRSRRPRRSSRLRGRMPARTARICSSTGRPTSPRPSSRRPSGCRAPITASGASSPSSPTKGRQRRSEPLWAELGVEPEPLCGAFSATYVDICPPSLQSTRCRRGPASSGATALPGSRRTSPRRAGSTALPDRPTVYVTLGTLHGDVVDVPGAARRARRSRRQRRRDGRPGERPRGARAAAGQRRRRALRPAVVHPPARLGRGRPTAARARSWAPWPKGSRWCSCPREPISSRTRPGVPSSARGSS